MHSYPIVIRFSDVDAMGHVNNAVYLTYFEQGRIVFFDELFGTAVKYAERGVIVASAHCNYKAPIHLRDSIIIKIWCSKIGTKSFEISYSLWLGNTFLPVELANGTTTMVCYNYKKKKSVRIPKAWKDKLKTVLILGE